MKIPAIAYWVLIAVRDYKVTSALNPCMWYPIPDNCNRFVLGTSIQKRLLSTYQTIQVQPSASLSIDASHCRYRAASASVYMTFSHTPQSHVDQLRHAIRYICIPLRTYTTTSYLIITGGILYVISIRACACIRLARWNRRTTTLVRVLRITACNNHVLNVVLGRSR